MKPMNRKQKTAAEIGTVGVVVAICSGAAIASGDDDGTDRPIGGCPELRGTSVAAL